WFGLELLCSIFASLLVAILVARIIGPARLGPYNYVMLLTNVTTSIGSSGLAITARKFMAEYLNRQEVGVAASIYEHTLKVQSLIAAGATVAGMAAVVFLGTPGQRTVSAFVVLSMIPRIVGAVPSQANSAAELMKRNTGPALIGSLVTISLTVI